MFNFNVADGIISPSSSYLSPTKIMNGRRPTYILIWIYCIEKQRTTKLYFMNMLWRWWPELRGHWMERSMDGSSIGKQVPEHSKNNICLLQRGQLCAIWGNENLSQMLRHHLCPNGVKVRSLTSAPRRLFDLHTTFENKPPPAQKDVADDETMEHA